MKDSYLSLFNDLNAAVFNATRRLVELERDVTSAPSLVELADLAYVLKETAGLIKGLRVENDKLGTLVAKLFFLLYAADPSTEKRVRTQWCSAEPDPKTHASIPKPDTDPQRYAEVMRALGVPEDIIQTGALRLSWEQYAEYCTRLVRDGKPIPGQVDPRSSYVEHRVSVRALRKLGQREPGEEPEPYEGGTEDDHVPF